MRILDCTALEVAISGDRCALTLASTTGLTRVLLPLARFIEGARGPVDCNGNLFPKYRSPTEEARERIRQLEEDAATGPHGTESEDSEKPEPPSPGAGAARLAFALPPAGIKVTIEERPDDGTAAPLPPISIESTPPNPAEPSHFRELIVKAKRAPRKKPVKTPSPTAATPAKPMIQPLPDRSDYVGREKALRAAWEIYIATPDLTVFETAQMLGCRASWLRMRFDLLASEPGAPVLKPNGKL